jgi:D-lactate dehydrogenase
MKIAFFDTHQFERKVFEEKNKQYSFEIHFFEMKLNQQTALMCKGYDAICAFVNDKLDAVCLRNLKDQGVKLIALRSAGFNHVDLLAAKELGLQVVRVPGYSPNAVAEYTLGLLLTLNRKIHKSYLRVKELNFCLDGLVGFDLYQKTVGVIGLGKIGIIFAQILKAMGCNVIVYDLNPSTDFENVSLDELFSRSDIISLHVPLNSQTRYLIDEVAISKMKENVYIINTGRGGLIKTKALIEGLKTHKIGGVALDVYEEEEEFFFQDLSERGITDDTLARLISFPNVLVSSHQAFLTKEALSNIAETTLFNIEEFRREKQVITNKVDI